MAIAMGLFDRGNDPHSDQNDKLAELVGRIEAIADRMHRHAAMCRYPQMQKVVEELAVQQERHLKSFKGLLAERNLWPRPPAPVAHEGSNDWGRLSGDLNELAALGDELHRAAIRWEGIDPAVAAALDRAGDEDADYEAELRKVALKCDPQALD
jgi:hypothetical protein